MARDGWTLGLGAGLILAAALVWRAETGTPLTLAIDLIAELPAATQAPPSRPFAVVSATVRSQTKAALTAREPARVTWDVLVPPRARWTLSVAIAEAAWPSTTAGVRFVAGVSASGVYETLATVDLNPSANAADRRWRPYEIDLAEYAGQTVHLICSVLPLAPVPDAAGPVVGLVGQPRIVTR